MNGSVNGNVTVLGSGTGTLIVPGGMVYKWCTASKNYSNRYS
jgi:hypothetical protein